MVEWHQNNGILARSNFTVFRRYSKEYAHPMVSGPEMGINIVIHFFVTGTSIHHTNDISSEKPAP